MAEVVRAPIATLLLRKALQDRATANGLTTWWIATDWVDFAAGRDVVVVVSRSGGSRELLVQDRPQMLVEIWAADQDTAEDVGQRVEGWIAALPLVQVGVHKVEWLSGPVWFPSSGRPRVQMAFYLRLRMQAIQEG